MPKILSIPEAVAKVQSGNTRDDWGLYDLWSPG